MLGGAIGAALGKISSTLLCSGAIGLFVGATASVLVHMMLYMMLYLITSYIFETELSDDPIGGYKSDYLAGVLGGITGLCSASLITLAVPSQDLRALQTFSVCWSAATFLPLILMLVILWRAERS